MRRVLHMRYAMVAVLKNGRTDDDRARGGALPQVLKQKQRSPEQHQLVKKEAAAPTSKERRTRQVHTGGRSCPDHDAPPRLKTDRVARDHKRDDSTRARGGSSNQLHAASTATPERNAMRQRNNDTPTPAQTRQNAQSSLSPTAEWQGNAAPKLRRESKAKVRAASGDLRHDGAIAPIMMSLAK